MRTDMLHKAGGGLITLIRDNITFTTSDIPSTINTHNTELIMVKVPINNIKHITIANIYIPPRDSISTHCKTADTDLQHWIQHITNIPHSVHFMALVHGWPQRTWNSRCHQQLRPHNTKHKHTNQRDKHHITTNIFTRYHQGV